MTRHDKTDDGPAPAVKPTRLDQVISWISPSWALKRETARKLINLTSGYRAASTDRLRTNWNILRTKPDPTPWDLDKLRERSRDANRNDPVASGASDTMRQNIVGSGLKPQSSIREKVLGISSDKAKALRSQAETAWSTWCKNADAGNRLTFDEIQLLAIKKIIEDGEILALPAWADEPWRDYGRVIELIEGDRLAYPVGKNKDIVHGIQIGRRGQPLAYYIRKPDKAHSRDSNDFERITARDPAGRPRVLHVYPTNRPGQMRGIPVFAPVLTYFKDLADYLEAEVIAARVAACLAVFITKTDPMGIAMANATGTQTSASGGTERVQSIEPGLVGYLAPNEDIKVVDPKRPGDAFPSFIETMLRIIGASVGLPYELIAKDFSKTNYSSARAALLEGRRMFKTWRTWFGSRFCQPIYELVIEESFLRGEFDAPDFYKYRNEYCRTLWIGGGWGWVDPVKEIEASQKAIDYGLSTMAEETAAQGRDWQEIIEQRKREQDEIANIGVKVLDSVSKGGDNAESETEKE
jgi:lambda family phage portal protein